MTQKIMTWNTWHRNDRSVFIMTTEFEMKKVFINAASSPTYLSRISTLRIEKYQIGRLETTFRQTRYSDEFRQYLR